MASQTRLSIRRLLPTRLPLCTAPPWQDMLREEKQDQYHPLPVFAPLTSSLCSAVDDSCIDESEREITLNFLMKHVVTKNVFLFFIALPFMFHY